MIPCIVAQTVQHADKTEVARNRLTIRFLTILSVVCYYLVKLGKILDFRDTENVCPLVLFVIPFVLFEIKVDLNC